MALEHFTDNILLNMYNGKLTAAVFLDLSKAFDTADHQLLNIKLTSDGLNENSLIKG